MFAVGERVQTEYGAGVVRESSARRVFIVLDDGQPLNVATGTYGYERVEKIQDAQAIDGTYECVGFTECRCSKCIARKRAAIEARSVPADVCTICGHYNDEAHHGRCLVAVGAI